MRVPRYDYLDLMTQSSLDSRSIIKVQFLAMTLWLFYQNHPKTMNCNKSYPLQNLKKIFQLILHYDSKQSGQLINHSRPVFSFDTMVWFV